MQLAREIMRRKYERTRWLLRNEPPRIVPFIGCEPREEDVSVRSLIVSNFGAKWQEQYVVVVLRKYKHCNNDFQFLQDC